MEETKSVFKTLNEINLNDVKESRDQKGCTLDYISWAWAWARACEKYPNTNYKVYENAQGWNYHTDGRTCWVKCSVTIEEKEITEMLPVMDYRNASILLTNVTSFDVNKSIQRCLTKALARHGLGLYVYAGEDLPETEAENAARMKAQASQEAKAKKAEEAQKAARDEEIKKAAEEYTDEIEAATDARAMNLIRAAVYDITDKDVQTFVATYMSKRAKEMKLTYNQETRKYEDAV